MQKKEKPRRGLAIMIVIVVILGYYYLASDEPFGIKKTKKITTEHIDSLQKIIPNEMYDFLFHNDSLKICLNSMAGYSYKTKDSTVYDSVISENSMSYRFEWHPATKSWILKNRHFFRKDSSEGFSMSADEDYLSYNNSWKQTSSDTFFMDNNGDMTGTKSSYGYIEKYEKSADGSVETNTYIRPVGGDTRTVITKDKNSGKILKRQEFSGSSINKRWSLNKEKVYSYDGNVKHTRTFSKDYEKSNLKYIEHKIELRGDSLQISKTYSIDSLDAEVLCDSFIHVKRQDKSELSRYYRFAKGKLVEERLDSSYYDGDSNHHSFSKWADYFPRSGRISNSIIDNQNRIKYYWSYHWNNDSTKLNKYENFGFFNPDLEVTIKFIIETTEDGEKRIKDCYNIKFKPNPYNLYKTSLYWNEDDECFYNMGITLKKYDEEGRTIKSITIR